MSADPKPLPPDGETPLWLISLAWTAVSLPLAWGVCMTVLGALKLFTA